MAKILVVEDDTSILNSYGFVLVKKGYDVTTAENGEAALKACAAEQFDLIVLDMLMPEMSGLDFLKQAGLKTNAPETKVLVLSNTESDKIRDEAMELGAMDYVLKVESTPYDVADKIAELLK